MGGTFGKTQGKAVVPVVVCKEKPSAQDDFASDLSALYQSYHSLRIAVVAFGVVFLVQVEAKNESDALVEVGTEGADESLSYVVARHVALSVNKFDEQSPLRTCHFFQHRGVFAL